MRYNPFNPQQPARPDFFVGRIEEIEKFEQNVLQTINDSPMNMAITGNRGMGKTSTLIKLEEIAKKHNCLVIRLSNYEKNVKNISELTDYIILNIKNEILASRPLEKNIGKFGQWARNLKPTFGYGELSLTIEERQSAAQTILRTRLEEIWDSTKKEYFAIVILIDEAESLERVEGALQFLREVFQRLSSNCRYSVVLSGKLNFTERMCESFSPLSRFFPDMKLRPFNEKEVTDYINRKLVACNVSIEKTLAKKIFEESQGHPYIVVSICFGLFNLLKDNENQITESIYKAGYPKIKFELEKDFFYPIFHPLTPKAKELLIKIAKDIKTTKFSFNDAVAITKMKRNQVAPYIQELVRKGCINKPKRAQYEIFHKMFLDFLKGTKEDE